MKLKFGNGTTVDIRKFTREYARISQVELI